MIGEDTAATQCSAPSAAKGRTGTRLFVADDHPLILDSLKGVFLAHDPSAEVACFTSVSPLEAALEVGPAPDLVLIDFGMPGLASVDNIDAFLGRHPDRRTAVFTGHNDAGLARDLIRIGCVGFVPKALPPSVIYHAVRLMCGGDRFLPESFAAAPSAVVVASTAPAAPGNFGLTPREIGVLRSLAGGRSNKEIGRELNIAEVTVKLHLRRSYSKLGVKNRVGAVRAVIAGLLDAKATT